MVIKRHIKSPGRLDKEPERYLAKKQLADLPEKNLTAIEIVRKLC